LAADEDRGEHAGGKKESTDAKGGGQSDRAAEGVGHSEGYRGEEREEMWRPGRLLRRLEGILAAIFAANSLPRLKLWSDGGDWKLPGG